MIDWQGCGECDPLFRCFKGETRCMRLPLANQAPEAVAWIPENVLAYLQEAGFCHAELSTVELPGREPLYLAPPNAEQIRADERERCAKFLEEMSELWAPSTLREMAKRIRSLK